MVIPPDEQPSTRPSPVHLIRNSPMSGCIDRQVEPEPFGVIKARTFGDVDPRQDCGVEAEH
jgi:hypothetical protein